MQPTTAFDPIEATVMGMREHIMHYFKGTCIDTLINDRGVIQIQDVPTTNLQYSYQRVEYQNKSPKRLTLKGIPVVDLMRSPNVVYIHTKTLQRSPELRKVKALLTAFFDEYLTGVERRDFDAQ
jgi:hypothetical protein